MERNNRYVRARKIILLKYKLLQKQRVIDKLVRDKKRLKYENTRYLHMCFKNSARQRRLLERAQRDSLTGLYNHSAAYNHISEHIYGLSGSGKAAIYMIDLDCFKQINDRYGHQHGDLALKRAASILRDLFDEHSHIIGRVGGDEFVVLAKNYVSRQSVCGKADTLCRRVSCSALPCGSNAPLSCSVGVAFFPSDADTPRRLISCADKALYFVKSNGRDNFCTYSKALHNS